jgi:hypothetical protein
LKENLKKQLKTLQLGDLIRVDWKDASIGKSLSGGLHGIDVPVESWGIFIGVLGEKSKYIILGQNNFRYADGLYDIDYTAIPVSWAMSITVLSKSHISPEEGRGLLNSFLQGGRRISPRQRRVLNHERCG